MKTTIAFLAVFTIAASAAATEPWRTGKYEYDGSGNIKSIGTADQFRYDTLGRLTTGTAGPGRTQNVTYDRYGNITSMQVDAGPVLTFGVDDETNRLNRNTANVFARYDDAGRLEAELGGAGNSFEYDATDMIARATVDGAQRVHLYSTNDERIATVAIAAGQETGSEWTLRDKSGQVLRRLKKSGSQWSWTQDYVHAGGKLLAAEVATAEGTLHFFPDHLGSARLVTGNGGRLVARHTYYPFGGEATAPEQDVEKLRFTGHERDSQSLDYMRARFYNPKWGRFLSVDRSRNQKKAMGAPQAWNRYAYARNSPHAFIDPDGLDEIKWGKRTVTIFPGEVLYVRSGNNDHVATYVGTNAKGEILVVDSTHERNAKLDMSPDMQRRKFGDNTGNRHLPHDMRDPVNGKPNPFGPEKAEVVGVVRHDKGSEVTSEQVIEEAKDVEQYHQDEEMKQCTTFCMDLAEELDYELIDLNGNPLRDTKIWTFLKAADTRRVK